MSNFGCFDLRVVAVFDAGFREAASAVGPAAGILAGARSFATLPEAIADCRVVLGTVGRTVGPTVGRTTRDSAPPPPSLIAEAAPALRTVMGGAIGQRVALLFGSEKFGLSNQALSYCDQLVTIPAREEHASMNLGQAAAICLYELARSDPAPQPPTGELDRPLAGELERLTLLLRDTLVAAGQPGMDTELRGRQLRALVRRASIPGTDLATWMGFFRQILWKLRR